MMNFKDFLLLEEKKKDNGIEDTSNLVLRRDNEGVGISADALDNFHNNLLGKKNGVEIHHHYAGSPPISFGIDPSSKQYFVSVSGQKPNFSHDDIDIQHGNQPNLSKKMKIAFNELMKILPRHGGLYHGSIMHTKDDVETEDGMHHFKPNDITYSVPHDSKEGKKIKNANIGVLIHSIQDKDGIKPLTKKMRKI